jgi:kynurenine formamidase
MPDVAIVQGLANLDRLKTSARTFIVLPLRIGGGRGAPCRAIAIQE